MKKACERKGMFSVNFYQRSRILLFKEQPDVNEGQV